jgi:general stress protein YciG
MANQNSNRGFAGMDEDRQREIAAEGGRASHAGGNQGGSNQSGNQGDGNQGQNRGGSGNFAQDRERASEAGRKGGQASSGGGGNNR